MNKRCPCGKLVTRQVRQAYPGGGGWYCCPAHKKKAKREGKILHELQQLRREVRELRRASDGQVDTPKPEADLKP